MQYQGDRVWSAAEMEAGVWLSFATKHGSTAQEVSARKQVPFSLTSSNVPTLTRAPSRPIDVSVTCKPVRIEIPAGTPCELLAISASPDGPVIEYAHNGTSVAEHHAYDVALTWTGSMWYEKR